MDSTLVVLRQIESHLDWISFWNTALLVLIAALLWAGLPVTRKD